MLDQYYQHLLSGDSQKRLEAAEAIAKAEPIVIEAYLQALQGLLPEREYPVVAMRGIVWAIFGEFPNPLYGKDPNKKAPMWYVRHQLATPSKKHGQLPPEMDPNFKPSAESLPKEVDWLSALAKVDEKEWKSAIADLGKERKMFLSSSRGMAPFATLRAQMLFRVALLRALGKVGAQGNPHMTQPIFAFAFMHQGVFRDECGRVLRSMGDYAVPELVRIAYTRYALKDREAKKQGLEPVKDPDRGAKSKYANYQLERLDRQSAKKALSSAPSKDMQLELFKVYGETQYRDFVDAVFPYINDNSASTRQAARTAWMRYIEGPAPDPVSKRYRKLPGGITASYAKQDFDDFRQLAEHLMRRKLTELKLLKGSASLKQMALQLFDYYDSRREHQLDSLFEQAKAQERNGQLKQATDTYQWILAEHPKYAARTEMGDAFYQYGEQLAQQGEERSDQKLISQALGYLRKALLLYPTHPQKSRIKARIHYLDGKQAQHLGGDGASDFELAVQADPTYEKAKQELTRARR